MYRLVFLLVVILGFFTLGPFGAIVGGAVVWLVHQSKLNTPHHSHK